MFGDEPRPMVRSVPYGTARIPDGDTVPQPPTRRPRVTRRQLVYGWVVVGLVFAVVIFGLLQ